MRHTKLSPVQPYDLSLSTCLLSRLHAQVVDYRVGSVYRRVLNERDGVSLYEVSSDGSPDHAKLVVTPLSTTNRDFGGSATRALGWILSVEHDLKPIYTAMQSHPAAVELTRRLCGLKPLRSPSLFEAVVIAITEQQLSLRSALAVRVRLCEGFGRSISFDGKVHLSFPTEGVLAEASSHDLRSLGLPERRARAIQEIAMRFASGDIEDEAVAKLPTEEAVGTLKDVPGVGDWTARYALCRALAKYDAVPYSDLALRESLRERHSTAGRPSAADARRILGQFGEHAGYAALYFIVAYALRRYQGSFFESLSANAYEI